MRSRVLRFFSFLFFLLPALLAACAGLQSSPNPSLGYRRLEPLFADSFDRLGDWRSYAADETLTLGLAEGKFRIDFKGRKYVWTQRPQRISDAVIELEATQVSTFAHNAFGVACRLDSANRGRGYFFLISGDGYASIRWSNGRSLTPIVSATPAAAIKRGAATNHIRAVCIDDYLALWVNGQFIAEARDGRAASGAVGLVGVMNYAGRRLTVDFDALAVWAAAMDQR